MAILLWFTVLFLLLFFNHIVMSYFKSMPFLAASQIGPFIHLLVLQIKRYIIEQIKQLDLPRFEPLVLQGAILFPVWIGVGLRIVCVYICMHVYTYVCVCV